jgi:hypothetical protein
MPVAKQLAYDHHAYLTPIILSDDTTAGANGITSKFAAFTAIQIRAALTTPNVASTAAGSQPLMFVKSGTATTTTTLTVLTSGSVAPITNVLATAVSCAQGDQFWVTHGTDATAVLCVAFETYPTPGAALACP